MASPEELLEQIRLKSQQPNASGFTGGQETVTAAENPFAVQTGVTPQAPVVEPTLGNEQAVPTLGGFEVRGQGAERFDLGTPESSDPLYSELYNDPSGNSAAIAAAQGRSAQAQADIQSIERRRQAFNQEAQARVARGSEVGTNLPDLAIRAAPYFKEGLGMVQSAIEGAGEFVTGMDIEMPESIDFRRFSASESNRIADERTKQSNQLIEAPISDPFGVTPDQIAQSGNASVGLASTQEPFAYNQGGYGVNSLPPEAVAEIRANEAAQAQASQSAATQVDTPQQGGDLGLVGFNPESGQSLSDYMAYRDAPQDATVQVQDAQGRFRRQAAPVAGETPEQNLARTNSILPEQEAFQQASADREARQAARPDFGAALSDRDRRAASGEDISTADRKDMAKANMRGASASDIARGNKIADELGVDLKTGKSKSTGMTLEQQIKVRAQNLAEGRFEHELATDRAKSYSEGLEKSRKAVTDEARSETAGKTMTSAISNMGDAMKRMGGRSGEFFGSGFFGKAASFVPGTSAYDQVADAEFLQSNVALNTMAELKELSPTGSTGFGALSEKELKVLTDKYANLNPFTSPELFQKNLKQLEGEFGKMIDNAWNAHSKEYGEDKANAIYGNRGGGGSSSKAIPNDRSVASTNEALYAKYGN